MIEKNILTAMMLLEYAIDSEATPLKDCGLGAYDVLDLAAAAHSYIQASTDDEISKQAQEIVATINYNLEIETQSERFVQ